MNLSIYDVKVSKSSLTAFNKVRRNNRTRGRKSSTFRDRLLAARTDEVLKVTYPKPITEVRDRYAVTGRLTAIATQAGVRVSIRVLPTHALVRVLVPAAPSNLSV